MKYEISFSYIAWSDYLDWQKQDKKMFKKINLLIESICRDNLLGKPERLKGELSGYASLRINSKDRLVYRIESNNIQIIQLKGHYNDK